ncbi:hypothetical protein [Amycolatopsis sp. PS_44_ISF1]|uniref:hypothetical protein n=1 Tax=Amycolatopsis sp. PS_44_ISF1 TaxID=2974917 RepID=UPI0028DED16A|nr:hypothetical protein [Amycolatopsis sp. PS_44_ISF1]MDT8915007.1 hypothetical protein [Amycolatopsis sp. PS_44_ISF1]
MSDDSSPAMAAYFNDFRESLADLQETFSVLREQHGYDDAVFDLIRIVGTKSRSWTAVHLAVAIADLRDQDPRRRAEAPLPAAPRVTLNGSWQES